MATFGEELRARRIRAGLSLSGLSKRTYYSRGYLSKIENGLSQPSADLARRCDAALQARGELAALVPPHRARRGGGTRGVELVPPGSTPLGLPPGPASGPPGPGFGLPRVGFAGPGAAEVGLPGAAVAGGAGSVPDSAILAAADERSLATLAATFEQLRQLGHQFSPRPVLEWVRGLNGWTRALAASATDPRLAARFGLLAARYAEYAGWMAQETGDDPAAEQWTRLAVTLAAGAGDAGLGWFALIRAADMALYRQDALPMIDIGRQAQSAAPPRVGSMAAQREAQGHALLGDRDACLRALDRSAELAAAIEPAGSPRDIGGSTSVADQLEIVRGWCMVDVDRPREAVAILEREIPRIAPVAVRARVRYGVRLALAHAAAGEADQATELLNTLISDIARVDSATIRVDLRRVVRELARWRNRPPTAALLGRLSTVLRSPYSQA